MPAPQASIAPHSWDLAHWPEFIYPHTEARARWIVRAHKDELVLAGALTRVGRELVFFGTEYSRWLQSRKPQVRNYVPNMPRRLKAKGEAA